MPSRSFSLIILIYWSIAAFCLFTWDVLPELTMGYPPDLRAITFASDSSKSVRWSIQVIDDPRSPETRRSVGEAITTALRRADGWYEMTSEVEFEASDLLRGTVFATRVSARIFINSRYRVDPSGNLHDFELKVRSREFADDGLVVQGQLKGNTMEIISRGPMEILNKDMKFDYEPRSVVQDVLGPFDRLPGLQVGQRWESRVINPFNGKVDSVRARVVRRTVIDWDANPVNAFEVEQKMSGVSMKTWVRTDGVILRQDVPFPFVRMMLERRPEDTRALGTPARFVFEVSGREAGLMIELRGVTKRFGAKYAVDGLDLEVRPGELFAFLGPNGAGKTTTIKMICGLLAPSSGTVRVGGFEASSLQARQLLGYVPDQPYLYDKLTGREFLKFVVEMYGLERPYAARRILELIDTFEMGDYVDELCENYSQGMKQRVVFASALVHDPRILVVDEPLVGLDPRSARIVKDLFVAQARSGCAVLMSTHLLAIAEELADRIGIVDRGKMLALGTLDQLRRQVQHHGPLEDLFLKLTGESRPTANLRAAPESLPESQSQPAGLMP